jgi:hypothetical protein
MKLGIATMLVLVNVAYAGPDADAVMRSAPACDAARAHCFKIQLHVTRDTNFVVTPEWIAAKVDAAARLFEPLDTTFELAGIDELPAKFARVATRADRNAIANGRLGGTTLHVFVVAKLDDVDHAGDEIRGVTWHAHDTTYIILSSIAPERTLAHELGHFFGLPHSTYAISIMNKTPRDEPPPEDRRFADEEIEAMRRVIKRMAR